VTTEVFDQIRLGDHAAMLSTALRFPISHRRRDASPCACGLLYCTVLYCTVLRARQRALANLANSLVPVDLGL